MSTSGHAPPVRSPGIRCALLCAAIWITVGTAPLYAASPHVVYGDGAPYIADVADRALLLRGINTNGLVEYGDDFQENVVPTSDDFREMSALGFNFLRVAISWSRVAPSPGRFDGAYLNQIATTVSAAEREGLRVLVDFHQDRYNRRLTPGDEADGAPDWATQTDGLPCAPQQRSTPCAQAALQHFWNNDQVAGKGLQDHLVDAMIAVSRRLRNDSGLLGIELLNEPQPGYVFGPAFERTELYPFYNRAIAALRADGESRMLWFEPNIFRDLTDVDIGVSQRFSDDRNLVYAPHLYTETFSPPMMPTGSREHLELSYLTASVEATAFDAPLVDDEWGGSEGEGWPKWRDDQLDLQDQYRVGSAFWMWKQKPGFYNWQTVGLDGSLRRDSQRAQQLARPHVTAVPGQLLATHFDGTRLATQVSGPGGTATLWGGTTVERGGPSPLAVPLTAATIDGRPVASFVSPVTYENPTTRLRGASVDVPVPAGTHTIELVAGPVPPTPRTETGSPPPVTPAGSGQPAGAGDGPAPGNRPDQSAGTPSSAAGSQAGSPAQAPPAKARSLVLSFRTPPRCVERSRRLKLIVTDRQLSRLVRSSPPGRLLRAELFVDGKRRAVRRQPPLSLVIDALGLAVRRTHRITLLVVVRERTKRTVKRRLSVRLAVC